MCVSRVYLQNALRWHTGSSSRSGAGLPLGRRERERIFLSSFVLLYIKCLVKKKKSLLLVQNSSSGSSFPSWFFPHTVWTAAREREREREREKESSAPSSGY
jgi:hypothetical protein